MQKPDYGLDAPALCRGFLIGGAAIVGLVVLGSAWLLPGVLRRLLPILAVTGVYLSGMGLLMLFWSRIKKIQDREGLLDRLGLTEDAQVLDVGCGRGLLLIGAALRLRRGKATGIDIWSNVDQGQNAPEATTENARRAGVSDRVAVETGDMRRLPYADASFDAVMSHWVVHNLPAEADRRATIDEMIRVLKPGGRLLIADIANHAAYHAQMEARGLRPVDTITSPLRDFVLRLLSFGSFVPGALLATKAT
jgi:arsenite methyltransferase